MTGWRSTLGILVSSVIAAAAGAQSDLRVARLGECVLDSGAAIKDCRVGYRTSGKLNAEKSNVVVLLPPIRGSSRSALEFLGAEGIVDNTKWFVVVMDPLGGGVSSSPSNSSLQPDTTFPRYTIRDIVRSEHRVISETLGFKRVHAVIGISLGGLQAFEWAVQYPLEVDRVVPIVGSPRFGSYDLLLWGAAARAMEKCRPPGCTNPAEYYFLLINVGGYAPDQREAMTPRDSVRVLLKAFENRGGPNFNTQDIISQIRAMLTQDISLPFAGSMSTAIAAVKAKMLIVIGSKDQIVRPGPARSFAREGHTELLELDSDCGHAIFSCEEKLIGARVNAFLAEPSSTPLP